MSDSRKADLKDEETLNILKKIGESPSVTQRELSSQLGISLGKVNYIIKSLINKGLLKTNSFKKSDNKTAYLYLLTPHGLEEKVRITYRFFKWKMDEYDRLKKEIEQLKKEIQQ